VNGYVSSKTLNYAEELKNSKMLNFLVLNPMNCQTRWPNEKWGFSCLIAAHGWLCGVFVILHVFQSSGILRRASGNNYGRF
jgi:hypothetical protein